MSHLSLSSPLPPAEILSDCLIVLVVEGKIQAAVSVLPAVTQDVLNTVIEDEAFSGKANQKVLLHRPTGLLVKRLVLYGIGESQTATDPSMVKHFNKLFAWLRKVKANACHLLCHDKLKLETPIEALAGRQFLFHQYQFFGYKTQPKPLKKQTLTLLSNRVTDEVINKEIALDKGLTVARDMANMPANLCTPPMLAEQAVNLDKDFPAITTQILTQDALKQLAMGAYLAVNQGSEHQASMPVMRYQGLADKNTQQDGHPIVLIGKGVTFDTGGITLKGANGMHHMIYDMGGAACILGVMRTLAELKLPVNVVGILATAENSIDGNAYRPGDILTSMSGQTIEVISTDAEGRLLLCDALTYAETRLSPKAIIDVATLTGAAITALGHHCSGLLSNNSALTRTLVRAGKTSLDPAWAFPLWPEYQDALSSSAADMKNTGSGSPGMITAGCFLSRFVNSVPWAHLDVAGTAFKYGKQNTATGRPISLLIEYLLTLCDGVGR